MTPTKLLGLLLVIVYIVGLKVLAVLDIGSVFEHRLLLPLLNTLFAGIVPIGVAYVAGKAYVKGGSVTTLFLGCGMLSFGLCAISAGWLIRASDGVNLNVTVYNTGALLGSAFHAIGAILSLVSIDHPTEMQPRRWRATAAYGGVTVFVVCFSLAALRGLVPPFFIQGVGPTELRQGILGSSVLLYSVSSILLMAYYFRGKSDFLYWYSLCLAMLAIGLFGFFVQKSVGSPIGWLGRSANYFGGIFAVGAVLRAWRDAKTEGVSLEDSIAGFFGNTAASYKGRVLAALPIPMFLILLIIIGSLGLKTVFEPPGLFGALNTLFLTILPLGLVYFAARGYLHASYFTMLMLGGGALTLGLGSLFSGWTLSLQGGGPIPSATILNLSFLLSATFHLLGGALAFAGVNWKKYTWPKELIVASTYIGIAVLITIVAVVTLKGFIPAFFVKGAGPTALRQVVVGTAAIFFGISGLLLMVMYLFSRTKMFYWYSLALFLITTAMVCYLFAKFPGDPIAWLGRVSTYFSGVYLLVAVVSASRDLHVRGESLESGIANLFRHHLEALVEERTLQLSSAKEELQAAHNELEDANSELQATLEERTSALRTVEAQFELLRAVERSQTQFITDESPKELFNSLLHNLLALTKSDFGYINELLYAEDGRRYLRCHAITDISWDEASRQVYKKFANGHGLDFVVERGLGWTAVQTREPVISNDPANDPRSTGLPDGHPPFQSFLGVPLIHEGEVIGLAGIANRPGGYDTALVEYLAPYVATCSTLIRAYRNENRRQTAEKTLFKANQRLQALMDALPVGVSFSDDASCRRITGNPCLFAQFEITPDDNVSASAPDIAAPGRLLRFFDNGREIRDKELPLQRAVAENGIIPPIELEVHLPSGRRWAADASGAPILDERGNVVGGVAVTVDITERKKAEQDLQTTLKRFYSILSNQYAGLLLVSEEGRIEFANQAFCDQFELGVPPSALLSLTPQDIIKQIQEVCAEPSQAVDRIREIVQQKKPVKDEEIAVRGGKTYLRDFIPIMIDGKPFGRLWHHRDVSDRRQAEQALKESEERLRLFIEHAPTALAMFDREMRYLAVSRRWMNDYRFEDRDIIGRSHYEILPEIPDRWKALHRRGLEGEVVRAEEDCFERMEDAAQWLRWEVRPWYKAEGSIGGIVIFTEDITDRKKAEEEIRALNLDLERRVQERTAELEKEVEERKQIERALRESESKYKALYEGSVDGILLLDDSGRILDGNEASLQMYGYSLEAIRGTKIVDLIHPEDLEATPFRFQEMLHGEILRIERRMRKKDGSYLTVEVTGKRVGENLVQGLYRDITERKFVEEVKRRALEQAQILEKIFDTTHFCVVYLDRNFNFISVNQAYADVCGYPLGFFPGKNHFDLYPHQENEAIFRRVVETGETFTVCAKPFEFPDDPSRGITYWDWTLHTVKDPRGSVEGLIFVLLEVTERKRAEDERASAAKEIKDLYNNAPCGYHSLDSNGVFVRINDTELSWLGYTREEIIGKMVTVRREE
ncbi:MAG: PAS domain S-box protein [Desulfomonilaceae bacterium]